MKVLVSRRCFRSAHLSLVGSMSLGTSCSISRQMIVSVNSVVPASQTASTVLPRRCHWLQRIEREFAPEYSGFYSLAKLLALQTEQPRSSWHSLACILGAVIPTLIVTLILQLIPLEDPALGWRKNPCFLIRQFLRTFVLAVCTNVQVYEALPSLYQPWHRVVLISLLQIIPFLMSLVVVAEITSVFPVPFSNITPVPVLIPIALLTRYAFLRRLLQQDAALRHQHQQLDLIMSYSFLIVFVYCGFAFAFRRVAAEVEIPLSLVLYIFKYRVKRRFWLLAHVQDHHDNAPAFVTCGAHLFHALFAIACLQTARSPWTFCLVLCFTFLQDALSIRRISLLSRALPSARRTFPSPFDANWTLGVAALKTTEAPIMILRSSYYRYTTSRSSSQLPVVPLLDADVSQTQLVAQLMHCREVVLLRMFVDLFLPAFYLFFAGSLLALPNSNRLYIDVLESPRIQGFQVLCLRVGVIVSCKFLSMAVLLWVVRSQGHVGGLQQLAFVVRSQWKVIQALLLINVLQIIDVPLKHLGNDFTFHFEWIKRTTQHN